MRPRLRRLPARLLPDRLSRARRDRPGATGLAAFGPPCSTRESGSPDLLDLDDGWAAKLGMPAEGAVPARTLAAALVRPKAAI